MEFVEKWITWYAAKLKYPRVLHRLCTTSSTPISEGLAPCLLENCVLHDIIQQRNLDSFDEAQAIVLVFFSVVRDTISPSIIAKIVDAMKVVKLFEMMKKRPASTDELLDQVNLYFPRESLTYPELNLPDILVERLEKYRANYRAFFLGLLCNSEYCESFLKAQYRDEFGVAYEARLRDLTLRVVHAVDEKIPMSHVEHILQHDEESAFYTQITASRVPAVELLLDACTDKNMLSEEDCLHLLNFLRPTELRNSIQNPQSSYFGSQSHTQQDPLADYVSPGMSTLFECKSPDTTHQSDENNSTSVKRKWDSFDGLLSPLEKRSKLDDSGNVNNYNDSSGFCPRDPIQDLTPPTDSQHSYPKGQVYRMKKKKSPLKKVNSKSSTSRNVTSSIDMDKTIVSPTPSSGESGQSIGSQRTGDSSSFRRNVTCMVDSEKKNSSPKNTGRTKRPSGSPDSGREAERLESEADQRLSNTPEQVDTISSSAESGTTTVQVKIPKTGLVKSSKVAQVKSPKVGRVKCSKTGKSYQVDEDDANVSKENVSHKNSLQVAVDSDDEFAEVFKYKCVVPKNRFKFKKV